MLILLDGFRIKQLLEDSPDGALHLESALTAYVNLIFAKTYPVHFVITKWDLLSESEEHDDQRLRMVRDLLLSYPAFASLVRAKSRQRVVRLIPVSAVGRGFARVDENGHVVKNLDSRVRPAYVELPLSVVIPDVFHQLSHTLEQTAKEKMFAEVEDRIKLDSRDFLAHMGQRLSQPTGAGTASGLLRRSRGQRRRPASGPVGAVVQPPAGRAPRQPAEPAGRRQQGGRADLQFPATSPGRVPAAGQHIEAKFPASRL